MKVIVTEIYVPFPDEIKKELEKQIEYEGSRHGLRLTSHAIVAKTNSTGIVGFILSMVFE